MVDCAPTGSIPTGVNARQDSLDPTAKPTSTIAQLLAPVQMKGSALMESSPSFVNVRRASLASFAKQMWTIAGMTRVFTEGHAAMG